MPAAASMRAAALGEQQVRTSFPAVKNSAVLTRRASCGSGDCGRRSADAHLLSNPARSSGDIRDSFQFESRGDREEGISWRAGGAELPGWSSSSAVLTTTIRGFAEQVEGPRDLLVPRSSRFRGAVRPDSIALRTIRSVASSWARASFSVRGWVLIDCRSVDAPLTRSDIGEHQALRSQFARRIGNCRRRRRRGQGSRPRGSGPAVRRCSRLG